jgi:tetratricopeptide (TPR) repeat protein
LEGSPLALELAATLVTTLPLAEIAAEINNNLDALTADTLVIEPRHRSIRAVFDSSWQTLSVSEQAVFARLSVFRGGFTREAAVMVAGATLPDLSGLIRKSFLSHLQGRYEMHELMRQYATEKLAQITGEQILTQEHHSVYYGRYLNQHIQQWQATYKPASLNEVAQEIDNVRAGFSWLLEQGEIDRLAPYLQNLWRFYQSQGRLTEAVDMLKQAITLISKQPTHSLQQAEWQYWLGKANWGLGKLGTCQQHLQEAVHSLGQPMPSTNGRLLMGLLGQCIHQIFNRFWSYRLSSKKGEEHTAVIAAKVYEQMAEIAYLASKMLPTIYCTLCAVNMAEKAPPSSTLAITYGNMMIACGSFGLHRLAVKYGELAERVATMLADLPTSGAVAERQGIYHNASGHWAQSEQVHEQAITIFRELKDERNLSDCLSNLAYVAYFQGDFTRYKAYWAQLDTLAQISHNVQHQSWAYTGQAQGLVGLGRLDEAMQMLAKAEPLLEHATATLIGKMGYYSILALAQVRRGEYLEALSAADTVLNMLEQSRPISYVVVYVYNELAEVFLSLWERALLGDPSTSPFLFVLKEKAHAICRSFFLFSMLHPVGRPYAVFYRGKCQMLARQNRQAYRTWQKCLRQAQKLQMVYLTGVVHYELSQCTKEAEHWAHWQQAKEIFTRLDAAYNLEQVENLLAATRTI